MEPAQRVSRFTRAVSCAVLILCSAPILSPTISVGQHLRAARGRHGHRTMPPHKHIHRRHSRVRRGTPSPSTPATTSPQPAPSSEPSPPGAPYVVPCGPPTVPSNIPTGDGWIVGGVHVDGGPAPGEDVCSGGPVVVTDSTGTTVASATTAEGQSYVFILPSGNYSISERTSYGSSAPTAFTIVEGHQTSADVIWNAP
jgi:hypothetical protein